MDTFAEIADERRHLADLLDGLTSQQWSTPSLCSEWTVRDVAAHMIVPLEVGIPGFAAAMIASAGSFDRANLRLAAKQAKRPTSQIAAILRDKAEHRFTPPGAGPEAPLNDLLVHGLDLRRPLGIDREIPAERARTALDWLTTKTAKRLVGDCVVGEFTLEARDIGWIHGDGPVVRGDADSLLLALTGRAIAFDELEGDGVEALRRRRL